MLGFGDAPVRDQAARIQLNLDLVPGFAHLHTASDPFQRNRVAVGADCDIAFYIHQTIGAVFDLLLVPEPGEGRIAGVAELLSFRGLDNAAYYELAANHQTPVDDTGTGGNFNVASPVVRDLVIDSLTYWSKEMGVDLLAQLQEKAKRVGANLHWFNSKEELIAYLNRGLDRDTVKSIFRVARFNMADQQQVKRLRAKGSPNVDEAALDEWTDAFMKRVEEIRGAKNCKTG